MNYFLIIKNPRCLDCKSIKPCFNFEDQTKGIYCGKHKKDCMIDVKNPRCQEIDCKSIQPCFNFEDQIKGIYCSNHKKYGMIDVKSPRCQEIDCKTLQPSFNFEDQTKGIYCATHKKDGMIDVKSPRCKNDWCDTQVNKKYEGYCMPCFVNNPENADKTAMRNYKTKELEVVNHIKKHFENYSWFFDKTIQD